MAIDYFFANASPQHFAESAYLLMLWLAKVVAKCYPLTVLLPNRTLLPLQETISSLILAFRKLKYDFSLEVTDEISTLLGAHLLLSCLKTEMGTLLPSFPVHCQWSKATGSVWEALNLFEHCARPCWIFPRTRSLSYTQFSRGQTHIS